MIPHAGDEFHRITGLEFYGVDGKRDFSFVQLKQDFTYQRSDRMVFDWGYDLRSLRANFDWENRVTQNPDDPTPDTLGFYPRIARRTKKADGRTIGAYVSDRLQLFKPLALELLQVIDLDRIHSAWQVRLAASGQGLEWVETDDNGKQQILTSEPDLTWGVRLKQWLLAPLVSEDQL